MQVTVVKDIVDNTTVVNYYYKKMEFSVKVDKIIDKVILNGWTLNIDKNIGKIEINKKELSSAKLQIVYKIRVTNDGELEGKVKLLEKIPNGTTMSKDNNQLWNISGMTATMTTEEIGLNEIKEYAVILDWVNGEGNLGSVKNIVDVLGTENEAGFDGKDAKIDVSGGKAELVISISTGSSTYVLATGLVMTIFAGVSVILVKKTRKED